MSKPLTLDQSLNLSEYVGNQQKKLECDICPTLCFGGLNVKMLIFSLKIILGNLRSFRTNIPQEPEFDFEKGNNVNQI